MAKKKRRSRPERKRVLQRQPDSAPRSASEAREDVDIRVRKEQQEETLSTLGIAIRAAGLAPIALLVIFLASHNLWPWSIPHWFQPIIDKEVAVLTLSAGHAGIIGLLINNRGRFTFSTYALFIAAVATALAGLRTIGESTPGVVIAMMLFLLTVPAVWAKALSVEIQQAWVFVRSWRGISIISLVVALIGIAYNQFRDEDYIKNYILIPFGILAGIALVILVIWLLLKLSYKYVPTLFAWLRSRVATAYRRLARRRGKPRN